MSEQHKSVLLPDAGIEVFALSNETKALADDIQQDWRFGRVKVSVYKGSVDQAIDLYSENPSPDLIIIETKEIDDTFTQKLQSLGQCCTQGTNAVVIGPENDIKLYRKLKDIGVGDYYVHPVDIGAIKNDLVDLLAESKGIAGSRIFALIGAKGGVGTTTIAQSLANVIARDAEEPCIILDCAGGRSSNSIALAKNEPNGTLAEAIRAATSDDEERLNRMVIQGDENLFVLSTGDEAVLCDTPDCDNFERLIDMLSGRFPNIVIDLGVSDGPVDQMVIRKSNDVVMISDPGIVSLRAARTLMHEILSLRGNEKKGVHLLINKMGERGTYEVSKKDIVESLETTPVGGINYNAKFFGALEFGEKSLHEDEQGNKVIEVLLKILGNLSSNQSNSDKNLDKSKSKATVIGGFLNKFTS